MKQLRLGHSDESGQPCEAHPIDVAGLLHLAAVGARTASFNHDIASKIQGVMMALDEIAELATGELKQTADTAQTALVELNQLLQQHRALTKPPIGTRVALHELLSRASMRVGVSLRGAKAACDVECAVPLVTQALAIVFDVAAGTERRRIMELAVTVEAGMVTLQFPLSPSASPSGETLAVAAWIVERDRGALHCGDKAISLQLPFVE